MRDKLAEYQFRTLKDELEFHRPQPDLVPAWVRFVVLQLLQAYWSITRLVGLAHLHDGSSQRRVGPRFQGCEGLGAADFDRQLARQPGQRIYLDMTSTCRAEFVSGIQRVMLEIVKFGVKQEECIPVLAQGGKFVSLSFAPVHFVAGDILLLLDSSWGDLANIVPATTAARAEQAQVLLGVYDLIPLAYPGVVVPDLEREFAAWFNALTPLASGAVTISKAVAEELRAFLCETPGVARADFPIGWFHLGADIGAGEKPPSQAVRAFLGREPLFFLSVGTVAPHKCHAVALDAFEESWRRGETCAYVIAGRKGWYCDFLVNRILQHPEYGRRLFWFESPSDADLAALYRRTRALIMPSMVEGFGLPIVEAAHFNAPVIASDIPVFREIAGDSIVYFPVLDSNALADRIACAMRSAPVAPVVDELTWAQAAANLFRLLRDKKFRSESASWLN